MSDYLKRNVRKINRNNSVISNECEISQNYNCPFLAQVSRLVPYMNEVLNFDEEQRTSYKLSRKGAGNSLLGRSS